MVPGSPHMAKVLVIDDEANLRKVLAALLRRDGYDVTIAEDGEMGLAEFQKNGADAVITDLVMPKLGGMEVLRAVNATDPEVPVIIITAHGTVDSAVEAIKLGAFDYVTKPFDQTELSNVHRQGDPHPRVGPAKRAAASAAAPPWSASLPRCRRCSGSSTRSRTPPPRSSSPARAAPGKELIATALHEGSGAAGQAVHPDQLRGHPPRPHRVRALRLRAGRLHRRGDLASRAGSSWPTAGRCSSTRSARSRSRCR